MTGALLLSLLTASFAVSDGDTAGAKTAEAKTAEAETAEAKTAATAKKTASKKPAPAIVVPQKYPTVGKSISITLNGAAKAADVLRFVYQPDSHVVKKQNVTVTGAVVAWSPLHAGIVSIQAIKDCPRDGAGKCLTDTKPKVLATKDVSVKFNGTPLSGLLVFALAGLLLFGGIWFSMRLIFAAD